VLSECRSLSLKPITRTDTDLVMPYLIQRLMIVRCRARIALYPGLRGQPWQSRVLAGA
jgi:hypothetical protein